jgi:hypothetical protein
MDNRNIMRQNYPGESVKRPHYTIHPLPIVLALVSLDKLIYEVNCKIDDMGLDYLFPRVASLWFIYIFICVNVTGGEVLWEKIEIGNGVPLKKKVKDLYVEFLRLTKLSYLGLHARIHPNATAVLHPVDYFLKHIYDRYFPRQAFEAFSRYKRTNPTLQLKLNELEKYALPLVEEIPREAINDEFRKLLVEIQLGGGFSEFRYSLKSSVDDGRFDELQVDSSSASGFPYATGAKKKDTRVDAENQAAMMLNDADVFADYMSEHVWYTTGRAKHQELDKDDAGRLIMYAGHAYLLMALLALQPWCRFMNNTMDWCGVGFSWMHRGAEKLASYMCAEKGVSPPGFRYVSLDISGWDTKLHHDLLEELGLFYQMLFGLCGLTASYLGRFKRVFDDMICAKVLMPGGHLFQLYQGMKSGWAATANDNTLIHEMVF